MPVIFRQNIFVEHVIVLLPDVQRSVCSFLLKEIVFVQKQREFPGFPDKIISREIRYTFPRFFCDFTDSFLCQLISFFIFKHITTPVVFSDHKAKIHRHKTQRDNCPVQDDAGIGKEIPAVRLTPRQNGEDQPDQREKKTHKSDGAIPQLGMALVFVCQINHYRHGDHGNQTETRRNQSLR